jgi:alkylation response protein AidB-like acyl-CoA dehydrogenase
MVWATGPTFVSFLSDEAAENIYGTQPNSLVGGGIFPPGKAVVHDGGYVVSGRWPYASGCHHSAWLVGVCNVFEGGEMRLMGEVPEMRVVYIPRADVSIAEDSWQVSGFAGTGSHDIVVDEVFVPEAYSYQFGPGMSRGKHFVSPLYSHYPLVSLFAFPMGAAALGIAQGAIEAVLRLAESKRPAGVNEMLRDRAVFHFQLADAVALVESARAWLYSTVDQAWDMATAGRVASIEERGRLALAAANATRSAAKATDIAYTAAGGTANYLNSPLQRSLRDIHALTQHMATSPQQWERAGRMLLGLDPLFPFLLL